ncbi:MAG: hypothetical protein JEY96_11255 [Bacteroidales bacterium]|nr:hypothetical protein [Bacteroidales bacterium]
MERYKNRNGDSGVSSFELGEDYIRIKFKGTIKLYKYSYRRAGQKHVERMKVLAENGSGLNEYVNRYVRDLYD